VSTVTAAMIGLGRMGGPMADNAARAGVDLRVFDVSPEAVAPRVELGATAAGSPAEAADGASVVGVVVFDDAQATEVVIGHDGVLRTLAPGSAIAIHTTVTLDTIRALASAAEGKGVHLIDAGISGGEEGAGSGTLLTMVGGSAEAVEIARPFLDSFSKEVLHAGPLGAGMALKLARNAAGYSMMAVVHESMVLAAGAGVELDQLQHVIAETGVFKQAMSSFLLGGPGPLPDDDTSRMRTAMEHLARLGDKDLAHTLDLAARLDVDMPLTETTRRTFPAVARLPRLPD
jgi:3-hydroxyisobutyrate dehydrogenase-like beta-hydroxyacid dehydrogenase